MKRKTILTSLLLILILIFSVTSFSKQDIPGVAVVNFSNNTGYYIPNIEDAAAEYISTLLSSKNNLQVIEREKLANIIQEQGLSQTGLVDNQKTAVQIGKLLGAEYLVTGSIINLNIDETKFSGYGIKTTKVTVSLETNIKVLNVNTGAIEQGNIYTASRTYQGESKYSLDTKGAVRTLVKEISYSFVNEINFLNEGRTEKLEKYKVNFTSDPEGASIEIDGIYMGSTPAKIPVEEGIHKVKISMGGYTSWDKKINVYEGLKVYAVLGKKESSDEND